MKMKDEKKLVEGKCVHRELPKDAKQVSYIDKDDLLEFMTRFAHRKVLQERNRIRKEIEKMIESVELAGFDNPVDEAYWNALNDVLKLIDKETGE
jgi:CRISPR/Cas system CSM-associated protein Csm4 (group 5 of RAMP superfamily)